jgi:hypothetical protein
MSEKMEKIKSMPYMWRPPFDGGDPPYDLIHILKEEQLIQVARLEVQYRLAVAEAAAKFYRQLAEMKM